MITIFNLIGGFGGGSKYYSIPDAPFTSGYNRAQTGLGIAGQLRPTDVGSPAGALDIVFTSNFTDGLSLRDFGTAKFRITNSDLWTVGGDVEFLNCVFDTPKSTLFQDSRVAGFSNTLIGTLTTNGNTTVTTLEQPTYISTILTDYDTHGLLTHPFWLNLHMGNRTK